MTDRTPGPYRWERTPPFDQQGDKISIFSPNGQFVTVWYRGNDAVTDANAEFLCRAANAHDALVEAAQAVLDMVPWDLCEMDYDVLIFTGDAMQRRAALATALAAATEPGS